MSKRGRPTMEGTPHKYTVPDDVHAWIKDHGGGDYLTKIIRAIRAAS